MNKNIIIESTSVFLKSEKIEEKIIFLKSSLNPQNRDFDSINNPKEIWHADFSTLLREINKIKENYFIFNQKFNQRI